MLGLSVSMLLWSCFALLLGLFLGNKQRAQEEQKRQRVKSSAKEAEQRSQLKKAKTEAVAVELALAQKEAGEEPDAVPKERSAPSTTTGKSEMRHRTTSSADSTMQTHPTVRPARTLALLSALQAEQYAELLEASNLSSISLLKTAKLSELVDLGIPEDDASRILGSLDLNPKELVGQTGGYRPAIVKRRGFRASVSSESDLIPAKAGYLQKKATAALKGWQRRWFVADGFYLRYYKTSDSGVLLACIDIRQVLSVYVSPEDARVIQIRLLGRTYSLRADKERAAEQWEANLIHRQQLCWTVNRYRDVRPPTLSRSPSVEATAPPPPLTSFEAIMELLECSQEEATQAQELQARLVADEEGASERQEEDTAGQEQCGGHVDVGTALRFLRARSMNMDDAEDFLRTHLAWRKRRLPILADDVVVELEKNKCMFLGRDRKGVPCLLIDESRMGKGTYDSLDNVMDALVFALEGVCAKHLPPMGKFSVIYGRIGASMSTVDLGWTAGVAGLLANNYPERLEKAFVLPVNPIVRSLWRVAKKFFDPVTAAKIELLPNQADLLKYMTKEVLPPAFGGSNESYLLPFDMEMITDPEAYTARTGREL